MSTSNRTRAAWALILARRLDMGELLDGYFAVLDREVSGSEDRDTRDSLLRLYEAAIAEASVREEVDVGEGRVPTGP